VKRFKISRRESFAVNGGSNSIFRSSERQQIIDYIIRSKIKDGGAELDEGTELGKFIAQKFPLHMPKRLQQLRHSWVTFWKQESPDHISAAWSPIQTPLATTAVRALDSTNFLVKNILTLPLDSIAEYFGEAIAFYFAYLGYYTEWLKVPALFGVIVFIFQLCHY
jgi:hypothetical protein